VVAYSIRRDLLAGKLAHRIIPAAQGAIAAWRIGDADALNAALSALEEILKLEDAPKDIEEIPEE
jgi:hypothetical protein